MLGNIRAVIRPASVDEAVARLSEGGGSLRAIAGGTATGVFRSRAIEGVVDLWPLGLGGVEVVDDELVIGATATLGELVRSAAVRGWASGAVWEAARSAGSSPLRNLITAGGNVAGLYPWSDLPVALLALDGRVEVAGAAAPGASVEELVRRHPSRVLGTASLVTRVVVPRPAAGSGAAFAKHGTSRFDYTLVDVAACVRVADGVCERARVAVGGIVPRCRRLVEAEAVLEGRELDDGAARAAGERAAEVVTPIADPRASADYRLELLRVAVARVVEAARARAAGGAA